MYEEFREDIEELSRMKEDKDEKITQ